MSSASVSAKATCGVEIALAGDQHGRSDIGDIGAGKACVDTDGEHVGLLLVVLGCRQARDHRADIGAPAIGFLEHRAADADRAAA